MQTRLYYYQTSHTTILPSMQSIKYSNIRSQTCVYQFAVKCTVCGAEDKTRLWDLRLATATAKDRPRAEDNDSRGL